jgi:WD40 repeat protein
MPPKSVPVTKHNEVVAHDGRTRCVAIGPASGLVLATGGDDCAVNVWRLGRPANVMVRARATEAPQARPRPRSDGQQHLSPANTAGVRRGRAGPTRATPVL